VCNVTHTTSVPKHASQWYDTSPPVQFTHLCCDCLHLEGAHPHILLNANTHTHGTLLDVAVLQKTHRRGGAGQMRFQYCRYSVKGTGDGLLDAHTYTGWTLLDVAILQGGGYTSFGKRTGAKQ
jgi:hypothetical protein